MPFTTIEINQDVYEGLQKDPTSGHYRVQSGYSHQANRYKIHETWLDEDDDLWIDGAAVEREGQRVSDTQS
jgi:hypothetical protein